jgi:hypothetical protein
VRRKRFAIVAVEAVLSVLATRGLDVVRWEGG